MSFLHNHPEKGARIQIHLLVLPPGVKTSTIVSEIKDTIAEGFQGRRQLPYAHWITLLILHARADPLPPHIQREVTQTVIVFPHYDPRQMMRAHVDL